MVNVNSLYKRDKTCSVHTDCDDKLVCADFITTKNVRVLNFMAVALVVPYWHTAVNQVFFQPDKKNRNVYSTECTIIAFLSWLLLIVSCKLNEKHILSVITSLMLVIFGTYLILSIKPPSWFFAPDKPLSKDEQTFELVYVKLASVMFLGVGALKLILCSKHLSSCKRRVFLIFLTGLFVLISWSFTKL